MYKVRAIFNKELKKIGLSNFYVVGFDEYGVTMQGHKNVELERKIRNLKEYEEEYNHNSQMRSFTRIINSKHLSGEFKGLTKSIKIAITLT